MDVLSSTENLRRSTSRTRSRSSSRGRGRTVIGVNNRIQVPSKMGNTSSKVSPTSNSNSNSIPTIKGTVVSSPNPSGRGHFQNGRVNKNRPGTAATAVSNSTSASSMSPSTSARGLDGNVNGNGNGNGNSNNYSNQYTMEEGQSIERNYDKNPTKLYIAIQHKEWEQVQERAKVFPEETKTWVYRREDNTKSINGKNEPGKLRWRLLPLHAAIIFKAPPEVIHALLVSYPRASRLKDDQEMLPIHLAFRNESPLPIVQYLLMASPGTIKISDRKGRLPFVMVQNSRSANKDRYLEALKMTESYHTVTKASCEYDLLHNFKRDQNVGAGNLEFDAEKINMMAKIDALEAELEKTQGASEVLVNHVNSLEAKLSSRNDTESYLASKIAKLDSDLRELTHAKELTEAQLQSEGRKLREENEQLQVDADELKHQLQEADDKDKSVHDAIETELSNKNTMMEKYKSMEKENGKCRAEVKSMEELLKKKIESEHSLANQVSALAARLAESTADTCNSTSTFQNRINSLTEEKGIMQSKLDLLTLKVQSVLKTLNLMSQEHDRILQLSTFHEENMATAQKHQESLAANAARNEQMMIDAAWEREEICRILTRQAKQVEKSSEERSKLIEEVKQQNVEMEKVAQNRSMLADSIQNQQGRMTSLMEDINVLKGFAVDDSHFCMDMDDTLDASKISNVSHSGEVNDLSFSRQMVMEDMEHEATIKSEIEAEAKAGVNQVSSNNDDDLEIDIQSTEDGSEISFDDSRSCESGGDRVHDHDRDHDGSRVIEDSIDYDGRDMMSVMSRSVDIIVVPEDDASADGQDHHDNDNALSLVDIESSVDKICSEAARLVASMPVKEFPVELGGTRSL